MSNYEIYIAIAIMTVINYFTRVFPFLFFRKNDLPSYILFIEKYFPSIWRREVSTSLRQRGSGVAAAGPPACLFSSRWRQRWRPYLLRCMSWEAGIMRFGRSALWRFGWGSGRLSPSSCSVRDPKHEGPQNSG
jgi:hypothetical protein